MTQRTKYIYAFISLLIIVIIGFTIKMTYSAYVTRNKIHEAFLLAQPIQNALNDYAVLHAGFNKDGELTNTSFGLPQPFEIQGTYIKSVVARKEQGSQVVNIYAYINTNIIPNLEDGRDIELAAPYIQFNGNFEKSEVVWSCSSNIAKRYLPKDCSGS